MMAGFFFYLPEMLRVMLVNSFLEVPVVELLLLMVICVLACMGLLVVLAAVQVRFQHLSLQCLNCHCLLMVIIILK